MAWVLRRDDREYVAENARIMLDWASEDRVASTDSISCSNRDGWISASALPWLAPFFADSLNLPCPRCERTLRLNRRDGQSVAACMFRCPSCRTESSISWDDTETDAPTIRLSAKAPSPKTPKSRPPTVDHTTLNCPVCNHQIVVERPVELLPDSVIRSCPSCEEQLALLLRDWPTVQINTSTPSSAVDSSWKDAAAIRLCELLSEADLRSLLNRLDRTIRFSRKTLTGEDRPSRKLEMARAILVQHEEDLFAHKSVRQKIAARAKLANPKRWAPGKSAALRFVSDARFPVELAGLPSDVTPPEFEFLEGQIELRELQDFQLEVRTKVMKQLASPDPRAMVTLPTGAGKTRIAVETVKDWLTERHRVIPQRPKAVIWLAHTEELCEQAYACFRQVWETNRDVCPLFLFRFWGRYMGDLERHSETLANIRRFPALLISTPARLDRLFAREGKTHSSVRELLHECVAMLIIDEAHRAAAPSYKRIIGHFRRGTALPIVGLTATPFRKEWDPRDPEAGTRELTEIFGDNLVEPTETLGPDSKRALQQRKVLAATEVLGIPTRASVKLPVQSSHAFLSSEELENIDQIILGELDQNARRNRVFDKLLPIFQNSDSSVLYFGPSVEDAECMAYLLKERGIPAAAVSGSTRAPVRRRLIREFRDRKISVLCNCQVLTTGFDAPRVTHVIMARPTVSRVLYEQMVGRGLRGSRFGGTDVCTIVDLEDNYRPNDWPRPAFEMFRDMWKPVVL